MSTRTLLLSAAFGAATLASACADNPAAAPSSGPAAPSAPAAMGVSTVLNIASTSSWMAEERLLPQQPVLALVNGAGTVNEPAGVVMTCNPDNGLITARLGKQATSRIGQSATYKLRLGGTAKELEGKFAQNPKSNQEADFVFQLDTVTLKTMAQLDRVSIDTDAGEAQWAFVRDPATAGQAKYIASLKNLSAATTSYAVYCNPK